MIVCTRCKTENADGRIRCGKCGQNISRRGEYAKQQGPQVIVLGSIEDLKRARETGELDTSDEDPTALGWLDSSDVLSAAPPPEAGEPKTRRVSVREIDKISGLKDLRDIQKALLASDEPAAPVVERPKPKIERGGLRGGSTEGESPAASAPAPAPAPAPSAPAAPPPPAAPASEPASAYLTCELFPAPYPLGTTRRYLMGRDPRASICIPSAEVSRRHAGISSDDKGAFWVEDLKSMNGTYVNGHAVLKRKLREGDQLDVGPFRFAFSLAKLGVPEPLGGCDPNEETREIRAIPGGLVGEIDKNGVGSVLQLLHAAKRSGVLTLRAGRHVGRVFLIDGEIHHAQFGQTVGEQALASLLPAEGGLLHFTDEKIRVKRTIERTTDDILGV